MSGLGAPGAFSDRPPKADSSIGKFGGAGGAPCAEVDTGPSGAADRLYFSSARKTGERVSSKPPAGAEPQFPKRLSNDSAGVAGGVPLAGEELQFPKRRSNETGPSSADDEPHFPKRLSKNSRRSGARTSRGTSLGNSGEYQSSFSHALASMAIF